MGTRRLIDIEAAAKNPRDREFELTLDRTTVGGEGEEAEEDHAARCPSRRSGGTIRDRIALGKRANGTGQEGN